MIRVRFYRSGGRIRGFEISGHSGYAPAGRDIVCAAVTSAVRLAECQINDFYNAGADVMVDDKKACIKLMLPPFCDAGTAEACNTVLQALRAYLSQLQTEYKDYISISEE